MAMKIPISQPWFGKDEEKEVLKVIRSGWVAQGPKVELFEKKFSEFVGVKHTTAVSSCTAALHLAAIAAGFGPGDEVLVPAFTWISTPNAVEYTGARPIFCDIDPVTFNVDPEDARRRVTRKTRGMIPVHLFGLAAEMDSLKTLAREKNLVIIEDAACALGTKYRGKHVGSFGDIACFSFHPRKSITTGEGGMLVTREISHRRRFMRLRNIGADVEGQTKKSRSQSLLPDFPELGFNYRMTDLQAAVGLAQLRKFSRILKIRRERALFYDERILGSCLNEWLQPPTAPYGAHHSYQAYVCMLKVPATMKGTEKIRKKRNALFQRLSGEGIAIRPGTHTPPFLSYYFKKYHLTDRDFPNARRAEDLSMALPLYAGLTSSQQERICDRLETLWKRV